MHVLIGAWFDPLLTQKSCLYLANTDRGSRYTWRGYMGPLYFYFSSAECKSQFGCTTFGDWGYIRQLLLSCLGCSILFLYQRNWISNWVNKPCWGRHKLWSRFLRYVHSKTSKRDLVLIYILIKFSSVWGSTLVWFRFFITFSSYPQFRFMRLCSCDSIELINS
jgi:hypothetical protein